MIRPGCFLFSNLTDWAGPFPLFSFNAKSILPLAFFVMTTLTLLFLTYGMICPLLLLLNSRAIAEGLAISHRRQLRCDPHSFGTLTGSAQHFAAFRHLTGCLGDPLWPICETGLPGGPCASPIAAAP